MKGRLFIPALLLAELPLTAVAQRPVTQANDKEVEPPPLNKVLVGVSTDATLTSLLASVKPQIPLGPAYVLQGYENEMTLVGQKMSGELESIERALHSGRITRSEAEYLIQQRYQVAMMQYEVFTALHDSLEEEIQEVAAKSGGSSQERSDNNAATRNETVSSLHSQGQ